jgi:hypothetical protein
MITLLFSWDYQLLGECLFSDGKLAQLSLSEIGHARIGGLMQQWQTEGIRMRARMDIKNDLEEGTIFSYQFIPLTSAQAETAAYCWASDEGHILFQLPERLVSAWEKICSLDLEPEERFACLQALRHAPHRLFEAWNQVVDKMVQK